MYGMQSKICLLFHLVIFFVLSFQETAPAAAPAKALIKVCQFSLPLNIFNAWNVLKRAYIFI